MPAPISSSAETLDLEVLLGVLDEIRAGDSAARLPDHWTGVSGKVADRLNEMIRELSVASKFRSESFANMSHELRTPLNSLLVLAEQLEDNPDGNLTARQVQYAHVIRTSGVDLLKLVNDILDLANVESNTVTLENSELSLAQLCEHLVQTFQPVADRQDLSFSVECDRKLPLTMTTDEHRLRQVLENLLSNAFKFTERGEVALNLTLAADGWDPDHTRLAGADSVIAISVKDTGLGIQHDLHAAVFETFAQADGTTGRRHGGPGLGLSISRNLVDLLGGEITLASELGDGSTFTVYLPLETAKLRASGPPAPSPFLVGVTTLAAPERDAARRPIGGDKYGGAATGATALIVDDDFRNIFALTVLLERAKMDVVAAESGADALDILDQRQDIDVVLMDIMMPGMNGYEAIAAIRQRPHLGDLPIIAVTGKVIGGERARCLAAGASDYIAKPVDTAELLQTVRRWVPTETPARGPRPRVL